MPHSSRIRLNIGSNKGNRAAMIRRAVALVASGIKGAVVRVSSPVESEPWGYESANRYLNVGVLLCVPGHVHPLAVLRVTQAAERALRSGPHRNADGSYRDRCIDIDIIDIDRRPYRSSRLVIPHPRMLEREFVLRPLLELESDW
ncbi:MAG: 2-amino-4-hydroxy-6-hydroxymethyldihydropteridine diphosphokinase [Muribaculaceae bacterium]|nr:2-amino-4-hydroxy-6-hydroxymethyldihydropteridine diphosphokinase [Muribaculaceae bacterium]